MNSRAARGGAWVSCRYGDEINYPLSWFFVERL